MKNAHLWRPTKYIRKGSQLAASKNPKYLSRSSWLIAEITAKFYSRYLKYYCKGNLLDLGCGDVPLYEAYKDLVTDVTCVDWNAGHKENIHVDFAFDLSKPIPLDSQRYDTIILSDVLEHIPNPESLWNELYRLLKPNGNLIINTPFYYWIHASPFDYYRYTEAALKRFARKAKIRIIIIKSLGGSPIVLADLLAKNLDCLPKKGGYLALLVQNLAYLFVKTSIGKRFSVATESTFPIGYFLIGKKMGY